MQLIKDEHFGGERPLFASHDLKLEGVVFEPGESALKCCRVPRDGLNYFGECRNF